MALPGILRRIAAAAALSTALAACAADGGSAEPSPTQLASEAAAAEPSALAADARDAVCEAFRIVEEEIRPAYDGGFETHELEEVGGIVSAGGIAIAALAGGLSDQAVADELTELGEAYELEGEQVAAQEEVDPTASDLLTDMVIAYGDQCPAS